MFNNNILTKVFIFKLNLYYLTFYKPIARNILLTNHHLSPITHHLSPITHYPLPTSTPTLRYFQNYHILR